MKPHNFSLAGSIIQSGADGNNVSIVTRCSDLLLVDPIPIVHGNHVTPNAFFWKSLVQTLHATSLSYRKTSGGGIDVFEGYPGTLPGQFWAGDTASRQAILDKAYTAAFSKLMEQIRGSLDLSIDLFQAKQTGALGKDIGRVVGSLSSAAKAARKSPLPFIKVMSQAWLTLQYGVVPLLQDIHDTVLEAAQRNMRLGTRFSSTGQATDAIDYAYSDTSWITTGRMSGTRSARCKIVCNLVIPVNDVTNVARLTSLNPASIAWELTPYSFVVDWFYNIGGYVRNLESASLYSRLFTNGCISNSWLFTGTGIQTVSVTGGYYSSGNGRYSVSVEDKGLQRVILTSFPPVPPPRLNQGLKAGSIRLVNAAALLGNLLKA